MHMRRWAKQVTLVVRGPSLAESMSSYLRGRSRRPRTSRSSWRPKSSAAAASVTSNASPSATAPAARRGRSTADALFLLIGARPGTEWLPGEIERDDWGYVVTGRDLAADRPELEPHMHETSVPGIFAVGDVRSGSVKRVASAVGEGSVVIQQVHRFLQETAAEAESAKAV